MMPLKRPSGSWIFLLIGLIVVRLSLGWPELIEKYYSQGVYPYYSKALRWLVGWLPVSVGDIGYCIFILLIFNQIRRWIYWFWKMEPTHFLRSSLSLYMKLMLSIYLVFNISWGLNYHRNHIGSQFGLQPEFISDTSLILLTEKLRDKTNHFRLQYKFIPNYTEKAMLGYSRLSKSYPFLQPTPVSIKPSLFGEIGNYLGYSGYFNPFTGEGQLNTTIPDFMLPFVASHEIGHQMGFAKEYEASFLGHLAAKYSGNASLQYSSYLHMFLAAHQELKRVDSTAAISIWKGLEPGVLEDIQLYRHFISSYNTPIGNWVDSFYHQYLKLNEQPSGLRSYNLVTVWLMAWYKKYGEI